MISFPPLLLRPSRRLLLFFLVLLLLYLLTSSFPIESDVIVSISSSLARLDLELPLTIQSILDQTVLPKEIRVYLPVQEEEEIKTKLRKRGESWYREEGGRVKLEFVQDQGPGTKFLPLLTSLLTLASSPPSSPSSPSSSSYLTQPLLILDDDHLYSPHLVSTLLLARQSGLYPPNAVLGLRGWRIRQDLRWGVSGAKEYQRHVVEGWRLTDREAYRVGVLTANEGYFLTPSHFLPPQYLLPTSLNSKNPPFLPSLAPILNYTDAPLAAKFVDDIWMSHHLSSLHHPRYIIPFAHSPSLDITGSHHTLESHLARSSLSRSEANDEVLLWGAQTWREEVAGWAESDEERVDLVDLPEEGAEKQGGGKLAWFVLEEDGGEEREGEGEPKWIGGGRFVWRRVGKWLRGWRGRVGCLVRRGRWIGWS